MEKTITPEYQSLREMDAAVIRSGDGLLS